ncbi:MAG TPA: DUF4388 domain-containing protein [Chloroflexia bacterium]|jgi:hypothetical protein|nr:DUF4388 domain-containing protein [Chloroflexia bacterium]
MALEGTLKDFPLPDIIQLLSLSRKTGAVEIMGSDGFGSGRLYFHQGKVVSAALEDMAPLDAAYSFFTFPGGNFRFYENELPAADAQPITISNEFLIMEGIRRADEWQKLRDRVPSLDLVLGLVADPVAGNRDINLKPDEWRVLTMINGRDSVRQIARRTSFGDFKTARIIYHLLSAGLIEPLGVPGVPAAPVAAPGPAPVPAPVAPPAAFEAPVSVPPARPVETPRPAPVADQVIRRIAPAPAAAPPAPPPARPPQGPALYARLEGIVVGELGNTGRLMLSDTYRRLHLQPGADLTAIVAGKVCDQFERDTGMLIGSGRARNLANALRRAAAEFFSG